MFNETCDLLYLFVHTTIFKINFSLKKEYYANVLKKFIESFLKSGDLLKKFLIMHFRHACKHCLQCKFRYRVEQSLIYKIMFQFILFFQKY